MRILLQKVSKASVTVDKNVVGQIGLGYLLSIGLVKGDSEQHARWMAEKIANLRLYPSSDKLNQVTLIDTKGSILVVSQFTLAAGIANGNRPDYINAMPAEEARILYEAFVLMLREKGVHVETGQFQAVMQVSSTNDGPYTLWLER